MADSALRDVICRLLSDRPGSRPSAIDLQAAPYFADDGVAEVTQRLQHAQQAVTQAQEQLAEALEAPLDAFAKYPELNKIICGGTKKQMVINGYQITIKWLPTGSNLPLVSINCNEICY